MLDDYLEPIVTFSCIVNVLLSLSLMDELELQEKKNTYLSSQMLL